MYSKAYVEAEKLASAKGQHKLPEAIRTPASITIPRVVISV